MRVHPDGVLGAGLHTEAAVDAFAEVDHKTLGTLLDIGIGMFLRRDRNTAGGADGLTHHAGHAAGGTVFTLCEPVACPGTGHQGPLLLGVLKRDGGPDPFKEAEPVKDMKKEIEKEMPGCDPKPLRHLRQIELFPKREPGPFDHFGSEGHLGDKLHQGEL